MWITGYEFRKLTYICSTIRWTNNREYSLQTLSILLLLERTELQRIERLRMFLQLRTAIGKTGEKPTCDGPHVAQTKDLRDRTGDLVSDLKISSDLSRNIYALEVHANTVYSNNSGLTVLGKETTLLFRFRDFTGM